VIVLRLALLSLANRRVTVLLTVLSIAVSVALLLGVEKVRTGARQGFANTISGTDLIVGARSGSVQLLLYSVFRIGNATNNVSWESYREIAARPEVAWTVPLSLGDSHRGFRVLGTTRDYFDRYRHGRNRSLSFVQGAPFGDLFDAVLGAQVAKELGYVLGQEMVVAHGLASVGAADHGDKPFRVAGILAPTGTPVDRTVHVSLEAIEAIHVDWQGGARLPGQSVSADEVRRRLDLRPKAVTAVLVGLKSRLGVFSLQRFVNEYRDEPLTAVLPGVALQELWSLVGVAETALVVVSTLVVATALLGMLIAILSTLNERRREMAILRSVGAGPQHVLGLLVAEAALLAMLGTLAGVALLYTGLAVTRPVVEQAFGLYLDFTWLDARAALILVGVVAAGTLVGLLPGLRAYRHSVVDGMIVRT
jgi:putative ABC transport system permease protein